MVFKKMCVAAFAAVLTGIPSLHAEGWLPDRTERRDGVRLLECRYDGPALVECRTIAPDSGFWKVSVEEATGLGGCVYVFEAMADMEQAGVAVAFDVFDWSSDNYVMIPSVVYNGNRQRIVNRAYATGLDDSDYNRPDLALTSNPIPQLSPEFGAASRLEVNVCNAATPVITYFDRKRKEGVFLFTDQGISWEGGIRDHGLIVEESRDRSMASFVISAPGVREKKPEFIGFSPSPDRGLSVKKGDILRIRVCRIVFEADSVPEFLARFLEERKLHVVSRSPRNLMPMSEVFRQMARNIDERFYSGLEWQFYCPENADWMSYGWVGGLINTFPMLALGDREHFRKVASTFDFALTNGHGASGFYYDLIDKDAKVFYRDGSLLHPGIGLTRKNADVLYWMVKQLMLLKEQGRCSGMVQTWEKYVRKLADAFVRTWESEGTWGNYLDIESGKVAVYNTSGGVMAVGGLALASEYFSEAEYLRVASEAALYYYGRFSLEGFTSGGCGDILQNADSETAAAFMTSLMTLYVVTGEYPYLQWSADLACLCSTWTVSFPYVLPDETPLAKLGANLTGAVWASTQNKHGAPGFCTQSGDALFKLYRATGNTLYADLLRDIIHAHVEGIQPNGKITERLTYCDADSRGSRGDGGKTGWNETNGALMSLEIPGIYFRKDSGEAYVFDSIVLESVSRQKGGWRLTVFNPTAYDAKVTIFAENSSQASEPLGELGFLQWKDKVSVKAGCRTSVVVR